MAFSFTLVYLNPMDSISFSIIIPVFNRPKEIDELLESLKNSNFSDDFEVVIVEDGSDITSEKIIDIYKDVLNISYYYKNNSGPGDSRNYGMRNAKGNYFLIFDSDCLIPENYLAIVKKQLLNDFSDCFGGPDAAHSSFTSIQKAINFSMTSFWTTGGIRGAKRQINSFEPRSFNMGISKVAFEATGGFGKIHPGEDPDLSIRLKNLGFKTNLFSEAFVYHKRRISWYKFFTQVNKFGKVRPILNFWHPQTSKLTYYFPSIFFLGLILSLIAGIFNFHWFMYLYLIYFTLLFFSALIMTQNLIIAILAMWATIIQFFGYGLGFLVSSYYIHVLRITPEKAFPNLFFK